MTRVSPKVLALLGALTLVWGTNWPLFKIALGELPKNSVEAHVVFSNAAKQVWAQEIGELPSLPFPTWKTHDFNAPFASGSAGFGATFDTSQFPDGDHRFSCVVRKFGEEKVIMSRTIRTRNARANLAEAPNTSKAIR